MSQADWKYMFKAVQDNDADILNYYIQQGIDLNFQHPEYFTSALIESIRLGHHRITQILLENGASPDICEVESDKTARQIAEGLNNKEATRLINFYSGTNASPQEPHFNSNKSLNQNMKAVICTKYGPPEVLEIREVAKPEPKDNEVLVRIVATAVNSGDVRVRGLAVEGWMKWMMRLIIGFSGPRKSILGTVYSGIVERAGSKVSSFKTGDKVFGMTGFSFGTYAEYITVKERDNIAFMPKNASYEEAASLIFGGQTAIHFLEKAGIKERKTPKVLIIGATGSVGTAATQIALYYGADVTAVCSTQGKEIVENAGISQIILYDKEDFTKQENRFDIIFDAVGKTSSKQCKPLLNKGGIYKTVGGTEVASESREQLEFLKELYEKGHLKAVIDKIYPMNQIVEAHRYVDTGRKKGNVVLKISD